jgi:putative SOS response-associated peptidase YedK
VVPVSAFYEWTGGRGGKQTYAFRGSDSANLWIAGLWEQNAKIDEHGGHCFTMITTGANATVSALHHRMPAIIADHNIEEFLSAETPIDLIRPWEGDLETFTWQNPLKMKTPFPPIASSIQEDLF